MNRIDVENFWKYLTSSHFHTPNIRGVLLKKMYKEKMRKKITLWNQYTLRSAQNLKCVDAIQPVVSLLLSVL